MKTVNANVSAALREDDAVKALPKLLADWNMNRYVEVVADNTPSEDSEGYDIELFPIESIIEPIRPKKGICKARIGESTIGDDYETTVRRARYYLADPGDVYKYWTSPYQSSGAAAIASCKPQIVYGETVAVNKIVITLENTWASPNSFVVETTIDGAVWNTGITSANIASGWEASGQIVLYWTGAVWTRTKPTVLTAMTNIKGIRLNVSTLKGGYKENGEQTTYRIKNEATGGFTEGTTNGQNAFFSLIELSARKEVDLTQYLVSTDDTFDMSDVSLLYPIGTLTSNVGNVSLWNEGSLFSRDNAASPYKKFLEPNVELNLEYVYDIDGIKYPVQQFKMYTDTWNGQKDEVVTIQLADYSKFFQEVSPRAAVWEGLTVPEIISRLCDSIGFVDYKVDRLDDRVTHFKIPVFWTDGSQTMWEVLDELAKASQTAIYFDGFGILQVKTREFAFNDTAAANWTLLGQANGINLANIVSVDQQMIYEANHVKVNYKATKWSDYNNGQPAMQSVWQPESTQTLRAAPLRRTLAASDTFIWIPSDAVIYWPPTGLVNIQGELIRFDGKQYVYYTGASGLTRNVAVVNSSDEHKKFADKTPPSYSHKNHFTGGLRISERGVWNSENKRHSVEAEGYSVRHIVGGVHRTGVAGFTHIKKDSKIQLASTSRFQDYRDMLFVTRGQTADTGFFYYGTRMNFVKEAGRVDQIAGLFIHDNTAQEDGYYFEFKPSDLITAKVRTNRHELLVYSRKNGVHKRLGPVQGTAIAIAENVEYDLDIYITADHTITVSVNGRNILTTQVPTEWRNTKNGRFGFFTKGKTKAQFEYLYAVARDENQPEDDSSFLDRVRGEFRSGQWDREWVFRWRTEKRRTKRGWTKERLRWNRMFFDEFGPFVHEVREYDVKFDPAPVLHSRLYLTNDWAAANLEFKADPFGAKFIVANASRDNAVIHGDDNLTYASLERTVNQALLVLGRCLVISDAEEVIAKSEAQIKKRGQIESELSSPWIQSKAMAEALSLWIRRNFGYGNEGLSVTIFGNTLIEVGDVVDINFPVKNFNGTKYFVTGASSSFSSGIETTLSLRRVNPLV